MPIPRLDETTFVHRIFGGYFRSQLKCNKCGYKSNTYDPFLDLALEVSKKYLDSLEAALNEFTRKEKLDADNRWKCSGCKKHVCPTKHLSVFRPPLTLCIHLKRFDFGGGGFGKGGWGYGHRNSKGLSMMGNRGSKISKPIQFPAQLRLPLSDGRVCEYVLTGVIVHVGNSATSGHYTAYVKKPGEHSKCWFHMDDSFVEQVSEKTVLRQRDAYVLFYSRAEVKLEFPQPPPREAALKNGTKPSRESPSDTTTVKPKKAAKKEDAPVEEPPLKKQQLPVSAPSKVKLKEEWREPTSNSESKAKPSEKLALPSLSPNPKSPTTSASPANDSSAIKNANEANSSSSQSSTSGSSSSCSDSSSSDSDSSSQKNSYGGVKRSLSYDPSEPKPTVPKEKKMKGNNVEVILSRVKKRAWKPQEATKVNSGGGNVLLGNISVGGWDDSDDVPPKSNFVSAASSSDSKPSLRDVASKAMESQDRSRKRKMHLDRWDAMIDEGKVRCMLSSLQLFVCPGIYVCLH